MAAQKTQGHKKEIDMSSDAQSACVLWDQYAFIRVESLNLWSGSGNVERKNYALVTAGKVENAGPQLS